MIYLVIIVIVILILEAIITWVKNNKTKPKILHEVDLSLIKIIESNNSVHELDYTWEELKNLLSYIMDKNSLRSWSNILYTYNHNDYRITFINLKPINKIRIICHPLNK